jgi:hypothetical protein
MSVVSARAVFAGMTITQRCLKSKQAALYLGVGIRRLRELTFSGELKHIPGKGKTSPWLYDVVELDRYIVSVQVACQKLSFKKKG